MANAPSLSRYVALETGIASVICHKHDCSDSSFDVRSMGENPVHCRNSCLFFNDDSGRLFFRTSTAQSLSNSGLAAGNFRHAHLLGQRILVEYPDLEFSKKWPITFVLRRYVSAPASIVPSSYWAISSWLLPRSLLRLPPGGNTIFM